MLPVALLSHVVRRRVRMLSLASLMVVTPLCCSVVRPRPLPADPPSSPAVGWNADGSMFVRPFVSAGVIDIAPPARLNVLFPADSVWSDCASWGGSDLIWYAGDSQFVCEGVDF